MNITDYFFEQYSQASYLRNRCHNLIMTTINEDRRERAECLWWHFHGRTQAFRQLIMLQAGGRLSGL